MEYVPGGDLMSKLIEKDVFSLEETRIYIAELLLAIDTVHSMSYIHRFFFFFIFFSSQKKKKTKKIR